ncbi:MAG: DUF6390 family protein [Acidimicrobiia bacterium]
MNDGPALFSRFAHPPNSLGYCGPDDVTWLGELVKAGVTTGDELHHAITAFAGAWPYLELIAGRTNRDPLDHTVVEAYWLGSPLLDTIDPLAWGNSVDERFRGRAGWDWDQISGALNDGGVPTHAFHVFCVYPWVGLLRSGAVDQALDVLERCRIRWGRVVSASNGTVLVESQPLAWDGQLLHLGPHRVESVDASIDPSLPEVSPGATVAMHWNYVCQQLTDQQVRWLQRYHDLHLAIANRSAVWRPVEA